MYTSSLSFLFFLFLLLLVEKSFFSGKVNFLVVQWNTHLFFSQEFSFFLFFFSSELKWQTTQIFPWYSFAELLRNFSLYFLGV